MPAVSSLVVVIACLVVTITAMGSGGVLQPRANRAPIRTDLNHRARQSLPSNVPVVMGQSSRPRLQFANQTFYIVASPESSGNRYTVSLLQATGCFGRSGHGQPFDIQADWNAINKAGFYGAARSAQCYVMHRSVPHARSWPSLPVIVDNVRRLKLNPVVIRIHRNESIVALSQVREKHVRTLDEARQHISKAEDTLREQHQWIRAQGVPVVELEFARMGDDAYMRDNFYSMIGREAPRKTAATIFKNPDERYRGKLRKSE